MGLALAGQGREQGRGKKRGDGVTDSRLRLDRRLLLPGQRLCCAVSGGADSTALLLALHEAAGEREAPGVVLSAVHVHHGLRGAEADGDEAFVRELCDRIAIPLRVVAVDTPARQADAAEGLEAAARFLRYEAFRTLLEAGEVDAVATAHTLDDQAETVLLKFLRGAWTEGLGGISPALELAGASASPNAPFKYGIIRPLLATTRAEVEVFLTARSQPWREDSSNRDLSLARNRVRHELLPLLRTYNPRLTELLGRTAEIARDEEAYWGAETARGLAAHWLPGTPVRGGGRAVGTAPGERSGALDVVRLQALPRALARRVLRAATRSMGARLSADETSRLLSLGGVPSGGYPAGRIGAKVDLAGLRAERTARELRLWGHFGSGASSSEQNFQPMEDSPE